MYGEVIKRKIMLSMNNLNNYCFTPVHTVWVCLWTTCSNIII